MTATNAWNGRRSLPPHARCREDSSEYVIELEVDDADVEAIAATYLHGRVEIRLPRIRAAGADLHVHPDAGGV